jgi:hypothetical protein
MARQQLIVDTKTPAACAGAVGTPYIVSYTPTSGGGWVKKGDNINGEARDDRSGDSVSLSSDGNVVAIGARYNDGTGFSNVGHVRVYAWNGTTWEKRGGDIDGEARGDLSGYSVSLSSDGTIVAIGAYSNNGGGLSNIGHVRVYAWNGTTWEKRGGDIDGEGSDDHSGISVSLSSDGNVVAIGARYNNGGGLSNSGHVRVYKYDEDKDAAVTDQTASDFGPIGWNRLGADIDGAATNDSSGYNVSLSSDGSIVAIGAYLNDAFAGDVGHVRVYQYDVAKTTAQLDESQAGFGPIGWNRLGADIDGESGDDRSGVSVSLSSEGTIVAIGAFFNDGSQLYSNVGHVRVYKYDSGSPAETDQSSSDFGPVGWRRLGADIEGEAASDLSGYSVSLSSDGSIVAIGAYNNDGGGGNAGHVRVYEYKTITEDEYDNGNTDDTAGVVGVPIIIDGGVSWGASTKFWVQQSDDIDGEATSDLSGYSVSLNDNGGTVAIGAPYADSNGLSNNGDVRVYRIGSSISPQVGDWAVAEHKETDTGADLSTYTYRVTHVTDADTLVLKFVSSSDFSDGAWDIIRGGYSGNSLSIVSETLSPGGLAFSSDGTKAYIIGGMTIYQYDLTTPWDISSGSYTSQKIICSNCSPTSLVFSSDGTKMFLLVRDSVNGNHDIYQYSASPSWSISNIAYTGKSLKVSPFGPFPYNYTLHPTAISISSDGTKVYVVSTEPDKIYQYTLTTPWDISSGSADNPTSLSIGTDQTSTGLAFSSDGTKVYTIGTSNRYIYQYTLSTPWDISSGSYSGGHLWVGSQDPAPRGLAFSSDGKKVYTIGFGNASLGIPPTIYQYTLFDLHPDASPCDLCDGTGPPGGCPIAPHVIKRDLGGMFMMLLD